MSLLSCLVRMFTMITIGLTLILISLKTALWIRVRTEKAAHRRKIAFVLFIYKIVVTP